MFHIIPLAQRLHRSRSDRLGPAYCNPVAARPGMYKHWNEVKMGRAVDSVITDGVSVRRAALEFKIPRSTLNDRISGRVLPGAVSGRPKYLSNDEEKELVRFLQKCSFIGYPRSRKEVIAIVQRVCSSRSLSIDVTHGWWDAFRRRHPDMTLRTTSHLSRSRAMATDPAVLETYFDMLEDTLRENDLIDKPCQIFNVDESGMPFDPEPPKGVFKVGTRNPVSVTTGDKSQVTVVGCVNAAGQSIPPMVIWDRKTLQPSMVKGELPGTIYGLSANGWIDRELFHVWFERHFLNYAPSCRPLLLLMDGHSSHYCPEVIRAAANEQVILFVLPPNTTHLSQPLDRSCFGPLKLEWRRVVHEFMTENPGKVVTRYSFSELFSAAWVRSMTMRNIMAGFKVTGVYPFDRGQILLFPGIYHESPSVSLPEKTGLSYIPMYSPSPRRTKPHKDFKRRRSLGEVDCSSDFGIGDSPTTIGPERSDAAVDNDCAVLRTPAKPGLSDDNRVVLLTQPGRPLEKILQYPSPLSKLPTRKPKQSSRVLTSSENLKFIEEKQQKKDEEARKKEERKRAREEKKSCKKKLSAPFDSSPHKDQQNSGPSLSIEDDGNTKQIAEGRLHAKSSTRMSTRSGNSKSTPTNRSPRSVPDSPMHSSGGSSLVTDTKRTRALSAKAKLPSSRAPRSVPDSPSSGGSSLVTDTKRTRALSAKAKLSSGQAPKSVPDSPSSGGSSLVTDTKRTRALSAKAKLPISRAPRSVLDSPSSGGSSLVTDTKRTRALSAKAKLSSGQAPRSVPDNPSSGGSSLVTDTKRTRALSAKAKLPSSRAPRSVPDSPSSGGSSLVTDTRRTRASSAKAKLSSRKANESVAHSILSDLSESNEDSAITVDSNYAIDSADLCMKGWIGNLSLEDQQVLRSDRWLSANHISAANGILLKGFPLQNGLQDTIYLEEKLSWQSVPENFVQIIHVGGYHWACLSNKFCVEKNAVELFDSLLTKPGNTIKEQASTIMQSEAAAIVIRVINVQCQQSGHACGLFAIAMAIDLCEGRDPWFCSYDEPKMRSHLEKCFNSELISQFPQMINPARRCKRVLDEVTVNLFCLCRYPDVDVTTHFGDMVSCDFCGSWYHQYCVGVCKIAKEQEWLCPQCQY